MHHNSDTLSLTRKQQTYGFACKPYFVAYMVTYHHYIYSKLRPLS